MSLHITFSNPTWVSPTLGIFITLALAYAIYRKLPRKPQPGPQSAQVVRALWELQERAIHAGIQCVCRDCTPLGYDQPDFCPRYQHRKNDLVIRPNANPYLGDDNLGAYETLLLADATIAFFARPMSEMHQSQTEAIEDFQAIMRYGLIQELNLDDPSYFVQPPEMLLLLRIFDQLFFFGELSRTQIAFHWEYDLVVPDLSGLGQHSHAHLPAKNTWKHVLRMHRTRESELRSCTLASERLGTLLRMMLWSFQYQFVCRTCFTAFAHSTAYGWFFQKVARAIEDNAERLLGMPVDLGRMQGLLEAMRVGQDDASMHALREFGFM